jgi:ribosomal protein S18 acetylase RimI-like enzyme
MENNNFSYRSATPRDIEQLKALGWASYGQYRQLLTPENAEILRQNIHNNKVWEDLISVSKSFVCDENGQIIGMAFIIPRGNPNELFDSGWSYIRMLGVDPSRQGLGIARKLTKMCIAHARNSNEKIIALHTSEIMPAARHIYEDEGFRVLREIEPRLGKKYWIYTLTL